MRKQKLFLGLAALGALACGLCIWLTPAEGFGRRRNACCVQPCVQYVQCVPCCTPTGGDGPAKKDPDSTKVNLLLILDTDDHDIGKDVQSEGKALEVLLFSLRREQRGQIDFVEGKELTREAVLKAIRAMEVGPKETLLVYCNLHGEKQAGTGEQLLEMRQDESGAERETIARKDLLEEIKHKNARLSLLITDSCFQGSEVEEELPTAAKVHRVPVVTSVSNSTNAVLTDLLVNHEGVVNINSCTEGECAFGQVFTPTFIDVTNNWDVLAGPVTWEAFFPELKTKTNGKFSTAKDQALKDENEGKGGVPAEMRAQDHQIPKTFEVDGDNPKWPTYKRVSEAPTEGPPAPAPAPPPETTGGDKAAAAEEPAQIAVRLPENARLYIDDAPTNQKSAERLFATPALPAGRDFYYTLRAEMKADGQMLKETKDVRVRAGAKIEVRFEDLRAEKSTSPKAESATAEIHDAKVPAKEIAPPTVPAAQGDKKVLTPLGATGGLQQAIVADVAASGDAVSPAKP